MGVVGDEVRRRRPVEHPGVSLLTEARALPAQVFVDDSGRRRRWIRTAGSAVTVGCAVYVGVVVLGLSQTAVGPLETVPVGGNGEIAGFPDSAGTVPGLLQQGADSARAVGQGGHLSVPIHRPAATGARRGTAAPAHPAKAKSDGRKSGGSRSTPRKA